MFSVFFGPPGGENFGDLDTFATNPPLFRNTQQQGGVFIGIGLIASVVTLPVASLAATTASSASAAETIEAAA